MHFIQQTKKKWLKNEEILSMGIYYPGENSRYLSHNLMRWKTVKQETKILSI